MPFVDYPHILLNNTLATHAQWNENFQAIKDVVDSNLDGVNFAENAELTFNTLTLSGYLQLDWIDVAQLWEIKLPSKDGTNHLIFQDWNGAQIMKISSSGEVTIGAD